MGKIRQAFYNRKNNIKRQFLTLDRDVQELLNIEVAQKRRVPISAYKTLAVRAVGLGEKVEALMEQASRLEMSEPVLRSIADMSMTLDLFSSKLRQVAESKWGGTLISFPIYHSPFIASGELTPTKGMEDLDELDAILGEGEDAG